MRGGCPHERYGRLRRQIRHWQGANFFQLHRGIVLGCYTGGAGLVTVEAIVPGRISQNDGVALAQLHRTIPGADLQIPSYSGGISLSRLLAAYGFGRFEDFTLAPRYDLALLLGRKRCHVCGSRHGNRATLDRMDELGGAVVDNLTGSGNTALADVE